LSSKPTIGLEIHVELNTKSKMFCDCPNDSDEKKPNINVCPTCMGHPGTLPVINGEAIKKVIKTGLALNCKIAKESKFDRKNYFYPDLPKGYQISQYDMPLCEKGYLEVGNLSASSGQRNIRIRRIHLEEDTGRLLHLFEHEGSQSRRPEKANYSLVDFNRAGVPLMELVTEPDIKSGKEAKKFAEELQLILRYLGVSFADMEKGEMRVEVNISLSAEGGAPSAKLGTKVEIKNLNSFRVVEKAIDFEIKRQTELLEKGEKIIQETRGWHDKKEITFSQREKEEAHDYRYFPEPDLPVMRFNEPFINEIKGQLPEMPQFRKNRFVYEYGLDEKSAEFFTQNKDLGEYYEKVVSEFKNWIRETENKERFSEKEETSLNKLASNYLITDIQGLLGNNVFIEGQFKINPENFAEFIKMLYKNEISSKIAKIVLKEMFETGADPSHIIDDKGISQIGDETEIENIIKEVILKNPKAVEDYKKGKLESFQFLIGKVMAESKGRANPDKTRELLKKLLE